jgi:hypothetical protein
VWDEIDRRHVDFMAKQSPKREAKT